MKANGPAAQTLMDFAVPVTPRCALKADGKAADLDDRIREKIAEFKHDNPEMYFQDGMLSNRDAFKVAYKMFQQELTCK